MVHYTDIDLTGSEAVCSSYLLGRENETATEVLRLILPPKYLNCKFTFDFQLEDGAIYSSPPFEYSDTGKIEYTLPHYVMRRGILIIGVCAEDAATGCVKRVFERSFVCTENITSSKEGASSDVIERLVEQINNLEECCRRYERFDLSVLEKLAISESGDLLYDGMVVVTRENLEDVAFIIDGNGMLNIKFDSSYMRYDANGKLQIMIDGTVIKMNSKGKLEVYVKWLQ